MAKQNRSILKQYFEDGDTPSSAEFGELIDSQVNLEDTGEQIVKGTLSASIIGADAFQLKGLAFEQVTTSQITLTGSNTFGSSSTGASPIITSHSFFGPIYQESSGADSASYFSTPVNFGTTESPIKEGGIFIKKSINLNNAGQNQLSQSISASLLISGSDSHLAFDNNEITQYGIGNNLTLKSYSTLAESGGEINFETGDSNTPSNERVSIKTVRLPQTNSNSGYSNHDYGNLNVNDILSVNDTPLLHLVNNNTTRGPFNPIVAALQNSGKCLNLDTDFWDGVNNVYLYSNANNTTTTLERMLWTPESASAFNNTWGEKTQTIASPDTVYYKGWSSSSIKDEVSSSEASAEYFKTQNDYSLGVPNSSGYVLKIKYDGTANDANDVFPGLGGFYQYYPNPQLGGVLNQMNHTYVQVFKALLPATHEFRANENSQGNNNTTYWLTSNKGTGKWEWYARVNHVGDEHQIDNTTGHLGSPISSAGHIYITNNDQSSPTYGSPVTCYLASCTVYDMTEADALTHRRIGIGTVNPKAAGLHINVTETIASQGNPVSQSINASMLLSSSNGQQLSFDSNEIHHYGNNLYITAQGNGSDDGNIKFRTAINSDNTVLNDDNNTRLYISASGNVGIGTTTPGKTLEVIGDISASGTIYADAVNGDFNATSIKLNDSEQIKLGTGDDLKLYHNATNSWILNETGNLNIRNEANDGDIIFSCDDNAGNTTNYYIIDGGARKNMFYQPVEISGTTLTVGGNVDFNGELDVAGTTNLDVVDIDGAVDMASTLTLAGNADFNGELDVAGTTNLDVVDIDGTLDVSGIATFHNNIDLQDNDKILLGTSDDLQLYHDGTDSYINNTVGDFYIQSSTVGTEAMIFKNEDSEHIRLVGSTLIRFSSNIDIGTANGSDGKDVRFYGDTLGRYMYWDASENALNFRDNSKLNIGNGDDLSIYHDGTNSYIFNDLCDLVIQSQKLNKSIIFKCYNYKEVLKLETLKSTFNTPVIVSGSSSGGIIIVQKSDHHSGDEGLRIKRGTEYWDMFLNPSNDSTYDDNSDYEGANNKDDLQFKYNGSDRGFISHTNNPDELRFTGQHRNKPVDSSLLHNSSSVGYIVIANGTYINSVEENNNHLTKPNINESLPSVELSNQSNDKRVFGVISDSEDEGNQRRHQTGVWGSVSEKDPDDTRLIINSLGEGAIWVCNINGNLENGDYITSCEAPGLGVKQSDDLLHNYTVAKITQDCTFDLNSTNYDCVEFELDGQTYRKAFVGCTYHCG